MSLALVLLALNALIFVGALRNATGGVSVPFCLISDMAVVQHSMANRLRP